MAGGRRLVGVRWTALASLGLAALMLLPAALADTESPATVQPSYDASADAGALLAQVGGAHPALQVTFTWERATAYEVTLPGVRPVGVLDAGPPAVLSVTSLGPGELLLDPQRAVELLAFTDPHGLGVAQLPVRAPADPAVLVVGVRDLLGAPSGLDPQHLQVGGLAYTLPGVLLDRPVEARADGGLLAVLARGPVQLTGGHVPYARELGQGVDGERVVLLQADAAHLALRGTGLTAVLQLPQASVGAGLAVASHALGLGAQEHGGVRSGRDGVTLEQRADLLAPLLGAERAPPAPAQDAQGALAPLDRTAAAMGAALGSAAALAAVGLAALALYGKSGLLGLLAPLYARLRHDDVLNNAAREGIYRHIVANPGVNVSEVVKQFRLGWGATVYHLRVLERNHLVSTARHGRQVCYFQNGGAFAGQMQGISALRNANAALVARTILEQPALSQRELCARTGLAQPTVSWHLQRLEEAGLVQARGAGRKRYEAQEQLRVLERRGLLAHAGRAASSVAASASAPSTVMNA